MEKILLDTDIGCDMDDMQALAYLLARDDAEILGITTVTGEAAVRAELADMMCRLAEKKVPVYVGYSRTLKDEMFIQRSVSEREKALLGEFSHGEYSEDNPSAAIDFLHETIAANPGEITLCAIGPLTNIAKLFERYPDTPQKLGKLIIMGGRFGAVDTKRWGEEEWNIINDIDAAKAVFETPVPDVAAFGVELTSLVFGHRHFKIKVQKYNGEYGRMIISSVFVSVFTPRRQEGPCLHSNRSFHCRQARKVRSGGTLSRPHRSFRRREPLPPLR